MKDAIFANGFDRVTDLEIGPDGYMYVLSSEDMVLSYTKYQKQVKKRKICVNN